MIVRILRVATMLVALAAVGAWLASGPPRAATAADRSLAASAAPTPSASHVVPSDTGPAAPAERSTAPALETLRVSVPRLGIDLPLAFGDVGRDVPRPGFAGETPERVALVFPGSAPLRSGGNTYIYAHARAGMFLALWNVRLGDEVVIYGPGETGVRYVYRVTRIAPRVDPADTSWLDPGGPEQITLQTSTGPSPADPRFIVRAIPDVTSPPDPPASGR